jgi:hypothetical protein
MRGILEILILLAALSEKMFSQQWTPTAVSAHWTDNSIDSAVAMKIKGDYVYNLFFIYFCNQQKFMGGNYGRL